MAALAVPDSERSCEAVFLANQDSGYFGALPAFGPEDDFLDKGFGFHSEFLIFSRVESSIEIMRLPTSVSWAKTGLWASFPSANQAATS